MQLPKDFILDINNRFKHEAGFFLEALTKEAVLSFRINQKKINYQFDYERVIWSDNAYYLSERPIFASDPLWHAGAYYVQEASSMFIEFVCKKLEKNSIHSVLDLCAAPGGKSNILSDCFPDAFILANEVIKSRVGVLTENIKKWGNANTAICSADASELGKISDFFDLVLVDAPCSGEGLFRKKPEVEKIWSKENVLHCSMRQSRILDDIIPAIKTGGFLVYSTCTFNEEENQEQVKRLLSLGFELTCFDIPDDWAITDTGFGYGFYPHKTRGEGFFCAILQKTSGSNKTQRTINPKTSSTEGMDKYLTGEYFYVDGKDTIYAIPQQLQQSFCQLKQEVKLNHYGIALGEVIRNKYKPSPYLAFSNFLIKDNFETLNLSQQESLEFLERKTINLESRFKSEWILVLFHNVSLGWLKLIENRTNNYYPKEWMLRKHFLPESYFTLAESKAFK